MGCLNSSSKFEHKFGNIHLSGPCNRRCYFCIGEHMPGVNQLDNLNVWPLNNINPFIDACKAHGVQTIYLTGTNTDPLLYRHHKALTDHIKQAGFKIGIRTNGISRAAKHLPLYDCGSLTVCSIDPEVNSLMMGGPPPDVAKIVKLTKDWSDLKVNIVLGPENKKTLLRTIAHLKKLGIKRINMREPYGQPHVGNPWHKFPVDSPRYSLVYGMPTYSFGELAVTYWDVHYTEVESVNLYANGNISTDYPITRGHDPVVGTVLDQNNFVHTGKLLDIRRFK